ncbi:hypothetical protein [Beijerinckia sp. L45]|uniref:hypothetical protein n=1 Tax=Beijerinckia sp. L45 TaxID=1641855 RepID=UPI00131B890F|nr:hypothetical protein [Beijerinckia sp. L45]
MPFSANVFHVLIASPSDVPEERIAIAQSLHEWNSLHSRDQGKILLPVMWETHMAPSMGDRPQGLINHQIVRGCDILIGAFWTRLGSPTGLEESGTVEEVKFFLSNKKPVMLYYSKVKVDIDSTDLDQYQKLKTFKQSIRDKGIQEDYTSISELKEKLSRHLTIVMRDMSVGPIIDKRTVEAARASTRQDPPQQEPTKNKSNRNENLQLEAYTDRSFFVRGNTLKYKDNLKEAGGKWTSLKSGGQAWVFSRRRLDQVSQILGIEPILVEIAKTNAA